MTAPDSTVTVEALEAFLDGRKIIVGSPYQIDGGLWLARVANPNALAMELLGVIGGAQPQAAPGADALREGILRLLNDLAASASATHPSKKSQIEFEIIGKLRKILGET